MRITRPKGMPKEVWRKKYLAAACAIDNLDEAKMSLEASVKTHMNLGNNTGTTIGALMAPANVYYDLHRSARETVDAMKCIKEYAKAVLTEDAYNEFKDIYK